jgi:general secretion pathway protein A
MYYQFFGLAEDPFRAEPDPKYLFLTSEHRRALAGLTYAVFGRKRFVLLLGEVGTGKTTLLASALQSIPKDRAQFCLIRNPPQAPHELLEAILLGFGIKDLAASRTRRIFQLEEFLSQGSQNGKIFALVVDEVHRLGAESLEEVRLLGNFESLQLVLSGQPEVDEVLSSRDMRALKQRIAVRLTLGPLSESEVEQYIRHRWRKSGGGQEPPFTPDAVVTIYEGSQGLPRLINSICDTALLRAFEQASHSVTGAQVSQALRHLKLTSRTTTSASAEPAARQAARPSEKVSLASRLKSHFGWHL